MRVQIPRKVVTHRLVMDGGQVSKHFRTFKIGYVRWVLTAFIWGPDKILQDSMYDHHGEPLFDDVMKRMVELVVAYMNLHGEKLLPRFTRDDVYKVKNCNWRANLRRRARKRVWSDPWLDRQKFHDMELVQLRNCCKGFYYVFAIEADQVIKGFYKMLNLEESNLNNRERLESNWRRNRDSRIFKY